MIEVMVVMVVVTVVMMMAACCCVLLLLLLVAIEVVMVRGVIDADLHVTSPVHLLPLTLSGVIVGVLSIGICEVRKTSVSIG
jgi:prepilin signal peptidase PulO-like enzyme (type II secretory pathway)